MAQRQNLRYYRGQYDSSDMYDNAGPAGVISMYNPESQAQFIDAVAKRQERFDVAKMSQAQEMARIGEMETYDMAELTKRLKSFEGGINSLVKDKYNGDYSAAANEIATQIGTERTNPFYHFNKQKVEMGKTYLDAKMKLGSNFMSAGNPFDVSFQDWQNGKTFDFTPVNREDIVKQAAIEFSTLGNTIMSNPSLKSTAGGQYFLSVMQRGLKDPQALQEYLASEPGQQMIANIASKNPVLAQLPKDQVISAIFEGAHSAIGKTEVDYMPNRAYMEPSDLARLAGDSAGGPGAIIAAGVKESPFGKKEMLADPLLWGDDVDKISRTIANKPYSDLSGKERRLVKSELKKRYSTPIYELNRYAANDAKSIGRLDRVSENFNKILNNMQRGDIVGATEEDSRNLKDVKDLNLKSWSVITTQNPNIPLVLNLNLLGTPPKKGSGKAEPIEIDTNINPSLIVPGTDIYNMLGALFSLDNEFYSKIIKRLETSGNTEGVSNLRQVYENPTIEE